MCSRVILRNLIERKKLENLFSNSRSSSHSHESAFSGVSKAPLVSAIK